MRKRLMSKSETVAYLDKTINYYHYLDEEAGFYLWNKGAQFVLTPNFSTAEFECPCVNEQCVEQRISKTLVDKLQALREKVGPLDVTSGYRCAHRQQYLRGLGIKTSVGPSTHQMGKAADIASGLVPIDQLYDECVPLFMAIGTAKNFLHVDLRADKRRRWTY